MLSTPFLPDAVRGLTEAAACACAPWIGQGDKQSADAAAVDALRRRFKDVPVRGRVVIGEGEKDDAPYLAPGERVGAADAPAVDVAVDPLEGTRLAANAAPGALAVLALAPSGSIMPLGQAFYMKKLIGPAAAAEALDLDAAPQQVIHNVADALNVLPSKVRVAVQERPRHERLVRAIREAGAQVHLFTDGDLSFALHALQGRVAASPYSNASYSGAPVDLLWGIGGAPEGVLAAAAQRVTGGAMQARLAPRSQAEHDRLVQNPALPNVLKRTPTAADLVQTDTVTMALTGVTDGPLLRGVQRIEPSSTLCTETLVLHSGSPPERVAAQHEISSA